MLKIHYFASIREQLQKEEDNFYRPEGVIDINDLLAYLKANDPDFSRVYEKVPKMLVAVNQVVASRNSVLSDNDEVAFFPPMTGG